MAPLATLNRWRHKILRLVPLWAACRDCDRARGGGMLSLSPAPTNPPISGLGPDRCDRRRLALHLRDWVVARIAAADRVLMHGLLVAVGAVTLHLGSALGGTDMTAIHIVADVLNSSRAPPREIARRPPNCPPTRRIVIASRPTTDPYESWLLSHVAQGDNAPPPHPFSSPPDRRAHSGARRAADDLIG